MWHSANICNGIKCSLPLPLPSVLGSCFYTHLKKCCLRFHKHIENTGSVSQLISFDAPLITSSKQVCQQDYNKNYRMDFLETWMQHESQPRIEPINFWCRSR